LYQYHAPQNATAIPYHHRHSGKYFPVHNIWITCKYPLALLDVVVNVYVFFWYFVHHYFFHQHKMTHKQGYFNFFCRSW